MWKASKRHQKFRGANVANRFKLPFVNGQLGVSQSISDLIAAIREEGMSDLVSYRISNASPSSIWIELDPNSSVHARFWKRPRVPHVVSGHNA